MSVTLLPTAVGTDEAAPTAVGTEPAAWVKEAKSLLGEADSSFDQAVSTLANAFNRYEAIQTILKRAKAEAEAAGRRLSNREIARQLNRCPAWVDAIMRWSAGAPRDSITMRRGPFADGENPSKRRKPEKAALVYPEWAAAILSAPRPVQSAVQQAVFDVTAAAGMHLLDLPAADHPEFFAGLRKWLDEYDDCADICG